MRIRLHLVRRAEVFVFRFVVDVGVNASVVSRWLLPVHLFCVGYGHTLSYVQIATTCANSIEFIQTCNEIECPQSDNACISGTFCNVCVVCDVVLLLAFVVTTVLCECLSVRVSVSGDSLIFAPFYRSGFVDWCPFGCECGLHSSILRGSIRSKEWSSHNRSFLIISCVDAIDCCGDV